MTFQVGDRVVVIDGNADCAGARPGAEGVIVRFRAPKSYAVEVDGEEWFWHESNLTPIGASAATPVTSTSNPIFHFRATEELGEDSWNTLTEACKMFFDIAVVKQEFRRWEGEFKTSTGLPIPSSWRSAKSVIINAMKEGVGFVGRGKTAVEKEIKTIKDARKDTRTPEEKLEQMAERVVAFANQHNISFIYQIGE